MKPVLAFALAVVMTAGCAAGDPAGDPPIEESDGALTPQDKTPTLENGVAEITVNSQTAGTADIVIHAPGRLFQADLADGETIIGTAIGSTPLRLRAMKLDVKPYTLQVRALDKQPGGTFTPKREAPRPFVQFELPAYIVGQPGASETDARSKWLAACTAWTRAQVGLYAKTTFTRPSFELINRLDCGTATKIAGRQQFESLGAVRVATDPIRDNLLTEDSGTAGDTFPESREGEALGSWMTGCLRDLARRRSDRGERFLIASCTEKPTPFPQATGVEFSGQMTMRSRPL
jgi:hypothetical protein